VLLYPFKGTTNDLDQYLKWRSCTWPKVGLF